MNRLLDPRRPDGTFPFHYVPAEKTDVRETWRRARERAGRERLAQRLREFLEKVK